ALSLLTLIVRTACTIDLGRQMVPRREAQATADVIALDMSRLIDGRSASAIVSDTRWASTKAASAARNNWDNAKVAAETGHWDGTTFTPLSGASIPDAVRVTANQTIQYFFARVIGQTQGSVTRSAIALPSGETFGG